MLKRLKTSILITSLLLCVVNCAKRGSITGGVKDETPPQFVRAFPPNFSTNFDQKEIKIYFDEYISLENPQKQIIISPPMDPPPTIMPMGGASKYISIKFQDTLLKNTTYSINFGESVVDHNEGNPYPFFKYIFSTGHHLDSLHISGTVKDALSKKPDSYITIALYELDKDFKDSLVFTKVPRYVSNTLDSTGFTLQNLKKGRYKLIALKDQSTNYTYQPRQDKIGFYSEVLTLPKDTAKVFSLTLFKENLNFRVLTPKQVSKNQFLFGYEGNRNDTDIVLLSKTPENFEYKVLKDREKDTLQYWFKPFFEADSLVFRVTNNTFIDTITTRFKDQYRDSLKISANYDRNLPFDKEYKLFANTPILKVDSTKVNLVDQDTVKVPFKTVLDEINNEVTIEFERKEKSKYAIQLLPEAITDFVGNVNDSLRFKFFTKNISDYGKVFLALKDIDKFPIIVQVIDSREKVIAEQIVKEQKTILFDFLNPGKYDIRIIDDANANDKWDTGNFLKSIQPEDVTYYLEDIDVRANWELKY